MFGLLKVNYMLNIIDTQLIKEVGYLVYTPHKSVID
ncbi:hypothetical protein NIES21_10200 [Anabaenopsis circularis NIES-21]|uniref:Uncharacterized protein n=1 Tax=Anabaenopsis circularis NIES-21 TaxID=1085406 RepID=A0A1Z4GCG1_9CYAN|nr:hypothetical protein NIES21_10200 [Anabaenopsis circularis NIES-21]